MNEGCVGTVGRQAAWGRSAGVGGRGGSTEMDEKEQRMSAQHPHFFGFLGKW